MDWLVLAVFVVVYAGMFLGRLPGLAMDRTGIALLGAILLVGAGRLSPETAWQAIDVPTIALLFGLMVVSAQLRLGGFYSVDHPPGGGGRGRCCRPARGGDRHRGSSVGLSRQ